MFRKLLASFKLAFDNSRFVIEIREGRARLVAGRAPAAFLRDIDELAGGLGFANGTLRGKSQAGHVRLVFSRDIPESAHQRLRNVWHLYAPAARVESEGRRA